MSLIDIKKDLKNKKAYYGFNKTIKSIKTGKCKRVYAAQTYHRKKEIEDICRIMGVKLILLDENNKDIGIICKKRFSIGVIYFE